MPKSSTQDDSHDTLEVQLLPLDNRDEDDPVVGAFYTVRGVLIRDGRGSGHSRFACVVTTSSHRVFRYK